MVSLDQSQEKAHTGRKAGSDVSCCRADMPSTQLGARKHLTKEPMSIMLLLASEEALKPCRAFHASYAPDDGAHISLTLLSVGAMSQDSHLYRR